MTYSVHQHWDTLKVCAVGKSYGPEFYSFINNTKVRAVMERIAEETEEDYQKLITLLESFGVEIVRPRINDDINFYKKQGKFIPPPMTPCDFSVMIGNNFYHNWDTADDLRIKVYRDIADASWPKINSIEELNLLPQAIKDEVQFTIDTQVNSDVYSNQPIIDAVIKQGNTIIQHPHGQINRAMTTRIGKDLYFGTEDYNDDLTSAKEHYSKLFPDYRCHVINTGGHADSTYCPVVPGLIISLADVPTYAETFPDWEVVYLPGQSWDSVRSFLDLKEKNKGKWWVPGEELNDDFTEFVEGWLNHWVGYVEETVFDVNMLVIDEKNVVCNNYNEAVFKAFDRYGITPHVVNFRHRYFWDGGLHCITSDLHREGTLKDYFPGRG